MEERRQLKFLLYLETHRGGPGLKTKLYILFFGYQKPGSEATVSVLNFAGEGLIGLRSYRLPAKFRTEIVNNGPRIRFH
jgi:hypothetical protein